MQTALTMAAITLVIGLAFGLMPIKGSPFNDQKRLKSITAIASGIIIASALLVVVPEGFELAGGEGHDEHGDEEEGHEETPVAVYGLAILLGFLLMLLLEASGAGHAVHEEHHDHSEEHGHAHVHHHKVGWTLVAGLSLHAAADGLAIGAAIASGESALTTAVIAAVLIHKAPAAFSLGVFSMHERENESQAIKDVVLFSVATPLALIVSYLALADIESATLGLVMLFSAGSFLYVATVDTLPDIHNPETGRATVIPMLMGIAFVGILLLLASQMGWLDHGH